MFQKYVDIDSTHRNRSQFPNPNEFNINFEKKSGNNSLNSSDFICDSFGYETGTEGAFASTTTSVDLGVAASSINNFYNGSVLQITSAGGEIFGNVVAYDGATNIATISPALSAAPLNGATWIMRRGIPQELGTFVAGASTTVLDFAGTTPAGGSSTVDNFYTGMYVFIPGTQLIRNIVSYVGATQLATVSPPLPAAPGAVPYEVLTFSRANDQGLSYPGSIYGRNQYVNYKLKLVDLYIPRLDVFNSGGGPVTDYPYVYVEFGNINNSTSTLYSNNSSSSRHALFKVPMTNEVVSNDFVTLTCDMVQTIKYKPDSDHRFVVCLPNGEILRYTDDTTSPDIPNRLLQTSATICFFQV